MSNRIEDIDFFDILFSALSYESSLMPKFYKTKSKEYNWIEPEIFYSNLLFSFHQLEKRYGERRLEVRNESTNEQNFTGINFNDPNIALNIGKIDLNKYQIRLEVTVNTLNINNKTYDFINLGTNEQSCYSSEELVKLNKSLVAYHAIVFPQKTVTLREICKINHNRDQLNELCEQLKNSEHHYIDSNTQNHNFLHSLGEPLPDGLVFERVKWIDTAPNDKNTFNNQTLIELFDGLYKGINQNPTQLYDIIIKGFIDGNGKDYKRNNLKQAFKEWNNKTPSSRPERNLLIRSILKKL